MEERITMSTEPNSSVGVQLDRIESKLSVMDEKLDSHLERIAVAESNIAWLRGHAKLSVSIFIATVGFLAAAVFTKVWGN